MTDFDAYRLFIEMLNVLNSTLMTHKDRQPYRRFLDNYHKSYGDREIGVAIFRDDPDLPVDHVTIRLEGEQFKVVTHGIQERDIAWNVPERFLREISRNPTHHIQHPSALKWEWMQENTAVA